MDSDRLGPCVVHHRIIPGTEPAMAETVRPWPTPIKDILAGRGIERLYSHQANACDLIRSGRHVTVATPTASGKSLVYTLPVLEELIKNPDSRALYLFPLKALAQDQLRNLNEILEALPASARPRAAIFDGDTSPHFRRKIRDNPPGILMTNPEMLHLSMLPHHESWGAFFAGLTHIVVDEMHTYRGVMGSHMAHLFRRLLRVCARFGANPTFIFCSATIGNPAELAVNLTGLDVETVVESGAPTGPRHFLFINPLAGASTTAVTMLAAALPRELRTIVYAQSRKMTELIAMWISERAGKNASRISAYRSGFLPEERREIEAAMSSGRLLAVITTSALELGIDIGGLDLCILSGYPGSVMSTWQRGGRVGRKLRESAVVLIAGEDALDQYFMRNPADFFDRPPESAVINPYNPAIMARHLECAAAELPLVAGEPYLAEAPVREELTKLAAQGTLLEDDRGGKWYAARKRPHRDVNLRGTGGQFHIDAGGTTIGQIDEHRAYRETHPGAVYLHRGKTYLVEELDIPGRVARVAERKVDFYTRTRGDKSTEILEVKGESKVFGMSVFHGRLKVTERITGYERRKTRGGQLLNIVPLDLPPLTFETDGLWFAIPRRVQDDLDAGFMHFMGAIHAVEHAMIGILPLLILTDRNDLGGISTPLHEQVGRAAVFVYDGAPGGVGLTRQAFDLAKEAMRRTLAVVAGCPCETGCPSCVHSPKCGSGNRPIDKAACRHALELIMAGASDDDDAPISIRIHDAKETIMAENVSREESPVAVGDAVTLRYGVLDLETRRSAQEVGGWGNARKMGISVGVLYDSALDEYLAYAQDETPRLIEDMKRLDLVVGFNIKRFDYAVLSGLSDFTFRDLPTLDILELVHARLGYRLSLDGLASATLGAKKGADGLQALAWWKEGKIDEIATYCRRDVELTRDLYRYGLENGYLLFTNKAKKVVRVPVDFAWQGHQPDHP